MYRKQKAVPMFFCINTFFYHEAINPKRPGVEIEASSS
jgi:hypothetical protein